MTSEFRKDKRGVVWMIVPNRPHDHIGHLRIQCIKTTSESPYEEGVRITVLKETWGQMEPMEDPRFNSAHTIAYLISFLRACAGAADDGQLGVDQGKLLVNGDLMREAADALEKRMHWADTDPVRKADDE